MSARRLRILLVDDHAMFRKGVASLMASRDDVEVVGEAANGLEALEKARELMPDLILMDIEMPVMDGLKATRLILQELPYVHIVMLTVSDEQEDLFEAIKAGAQGYILKDLAPDALFALLKGVPEGDAPISPAIAARILKDFRYQQPPESPLLSARERGILQRAAEGASNAEIAASLYIAPGTVKNHLHNILAKLKLKNRAQAVAYALQEGLIRPKHENPEA